MNDFERILHKKNRMARRFIIIMTLCYLGIAAIFVAAFWPTKAAEQGVQETTQTTHFEPTCVDSDGNKEEFDLNLEKERLERERLEKERLEAERLERERIEVERLETERIEAERLEAERLETERLEKERLISVIAKVIYAEARGEPFEGKLAVGASVVNRMKSEHFPDDVEDVISGTYASIRGITDAMLAKVPECRFAAERAVNGEDPLRDILGGPTLYFYNPDMCGRVALKNREGLVTYRVGNHLFYTSHPEKGWP